jgi:pseudoazurin
VENDPKIVILDFEASLVVDQSALQAIEVVAAKYESAGKLLRLKHLSRDCHTLLIKAGHLMVDSDDDPEYSVAADYEVKMLNNGTEGMMVFEHAVLKVAVGDTVKFVATDMAHNSASVFTPPGATVWKGAMNEEISITIDKPGVYIYECTPHAMMAMVGVIQASDGLNFEMSLDSTYIELAHEFAKTYQQKFVMNNQRLDTYIHELE